MGRVAIKYLQDAAAGPFPAAQGLASEGELTTHCLVTEPEQSLHLRLHDLSPGARIVIQRPARGHAFYVWQGSVRVNGAPVATASAIIAEHGCETVIEAEAPGARIAHFQRNPAFPETDTKAGGHVHVVPPDGIFKSHVPESDASHTLWADSTCPTCDLWLHQTHMPRPTPQGGNHFHTVDEVLLIVGGGMRLGNRVLEPGTALAIEANTIYGFGVPEQGTKFINFRCSDSYVVRTKRMQPLCEPLSEREIIRSHGALLRGLDIEAPGEY